MNQPVSDQPPRAGANFAGMRFIIAIWLALGVILARVVLQVSIDRTVEGLHGDLLWEHAVEHLLLSTQGAWMLVVALTFLPRGENRVFVFARTTICAALCLMLLVGWPGGEPQYIPGLWSMKGRIGWLVVGLAAVVFSLVERWAMAGRRFHFRLAPATLFTTTAALLLVGGAVAKAVFMIVEARRIYMVPELMAPAGDLLARVRQDENLTLPEGVEVVGLRTGELGDGGMRPTLVIPAGSEVVMPVRPGRQTWLRFNYGVDADALALADEDGTDDEDSSVQFSIQLDGVEIFRDRIDPRSDPEQRRWFEHEVALGEFDGRDVQLRMCVDSRWTGAGMRAGYGRPRLVDREWLARRAGQAERPNVVVVSIDSLRADHMGCYGYRPPTTPQLDRLAAESLRFTRIATPSTLTWSSVASLLTGMYPLSHGAWAEDRSFLADALVTVPESLQSQRVTTGGWTNNPLLSRERNYSQGFEVWREFNFQSGALLTHEFVDFVRRYKDYQFFTFLHYADLRFPHHPSPRYRRVFTKNDDLDVNLEIAERAAALDAGDTERQFTHAELRQYRALYDAELRSVDDQIRELVNTLKQNELWQRTILIVTSPHGEAFQEHANLLSGRDVYQEQVHVPLLIRIPGVEPREIDEPADLTRLAATILHLLGLSDPYPPRSPPLPPWRPRDSKYAFTQTTLPAGVARAEEDLLFAVQSDTWKLIRSTGGVSELYDLTADPGEVHNLLKERQKTAAVLRGELREWLQRCTERQVKSIQMELDARTRQMMDEGEAAESANE